MLRWTGYSTELDRECFRVRIVDCLDMLRLMQKGMHEDPAGIESVRVALPFQHDVPLFVNQWLVFDTVGESRHAEYEERGLLDVYDC